MFLTKGMWQGVPACRIPREAIYLKCGHRSLQKVCHTVIFISLKPRRNSGRYIWLSTGTVEFQENV